MQLKIWNSVKKGVSTYTCGLSPSLNIAFEVAAINEISKEDTYMKRIEFEEGTLRNTTIQAKVKRREASQESGSKDPGGQRESRWWEQGKEELGQKGGDKCAMGG